MEVLQDVVFRMPPISRDQAAEMIRSIRAAKLFAGFRGAPPIDYRAVEDVLLRAAQLLVDHPEIVEMDVNPLMLSPGGAVAADGRIVLAG